MSIAIEDDHLALLETVRRFTTNRCPSAVVRAAIDEPAVTLPPFWDELAGLGWLGLHVPEDAGGEGYGFLEQAIVLEEFGRVLAPGPLLPTVWAAAVVRSGGPSGLVADLVSGRCIGTVDCGPPIAARRGDAGSLVLSGASGPVLCGAIADVVVLSAEIEGEPPQWCVVERDVATVTPLESLDATRPLATLSFDDVAVQADSVLSAVAVTEPLEIGIALSAAEAAGAAGWCVDTAASYATVRRQFGRPIGQFQGVKHRCANMLVALEQLRGVAWDAALALDNPDESSVIAIGAAGAVGLDAAATIAKDCIQVLGGIGFTWEHDAHLYLRRAMAMRQLFGGASRFRVATATAAVAGVRRHLKLPLPTEAEAFRDEVRAFADDVGALPREEQRPRLVEGGYLVPHWDPPWGRGAGAVEQLVIDEEFRRARVRIPHLQVGAWAAPTIAVHGTPEQQERWVRPTLLGEIKWCQLFSEPEAGSDLAALTTTAKQTDGGWLVTGQKVWTSMANEADWGICLVRTNPKAPKHLGITYVIVDMKSPGLDIRPLREMTGLEMFNEVFLDDVFVPDDCVIGEVDAGWPLARTTLANERVSMGSGSSFGGGLEALLKLVTERLESGALAIDPLLLDQLGALVAEAHTIALLGIRSTHRSLSGAAPGSESSVRKLLGVEHDQRTQEFGLGLLGPEGATTVGVANQWTFGFLANRCLTIAGGTSEVQRNVIAERLLGLPRDPEPAG